MNRVDIERFLRLFDARNIRAAEKWVHASCPLAPWLHRSGRDANPSFAIKIEDFGESYYNCFACTKGSLLSLVQQLHHLKAPYDLGAALDMVSVDQNRPIKFEVKEWGVVDTPDTDESIIFSEIWLDSFMIAEQSSIASAYLRRRGVSPELSLQLGLRYDSMMNAVCFPIRDYHQILRGMRARRIAPVGDQPRYHIYRTGGGRYNNSVWYGEEWIQFDKLIVLCESVFDVASVMRVYPNVLAPMSAGVTAHRWKRLLKGSEFVLFFDADEAGEGLRADAHKYLAGSHLYDVWPSGKDPGDMMVAELREKLRHYTTLLPERSAISE